MPTVRYGDGVQDARGSIGGQTYSKGRSGHLLKSRRGPVNKRSPRQTAERTIFRYLTQYWSNSLTQAQRDSWQAYGNAIQVKNRLGQSIRLPGFHHFIKSNSLLIRFGHSMILEGPSTLTLAEVDPHLSCAADVATQVMSVNFDESLDWVSNDAGHLYITQGEPKSIGVRNLNKSFRLAGEINGSSSSPPTSPKTVPLPYPTADNQAVLCKARIAEGDGRLSEFFRWYRNHITSDRSLRCTLAIRGSNSCGIDDLPRRHGHDC